MCGVAPMCGLAAVRTWCVQDQGQRALEAAQRCRTAVRQGCRTAVGARRFLTCYTYVLRPLCLTLRWQAACGLWYVVYGHSTLLRTIHCVLCCYCVHSSIVCELAFSG